VWRDLLTDLQLSTAQRQAFLGEKQQCEPLEAELQCTIDTLDRLSQLVSNKNETLDQEMAEIQKILTPRQAAKFILWVTNNPACMHMLNQLWNQMYSTAISTPRKAPESLTACSAHESSRLAD
jgi:hypothetical protein